MANDKNIVEDKTAEQVETQTFKVIAENGFTYDKKYKKGQSIELSDKKTIKNLLTNKLIK
jgi:hypothetical protein